MSIFLILNHPCSFMVYHYLFGAFLLLFSALLQYKNSSVHGLSSISTDPSRPVCIPCFWGRARACFPNSDWKLSLYMAKITPKYHNWAHLIMIRYKEKSPTWSWFSSYKTNRFQVAVRLFSNRSQKTSKCCKNISDTLGYRLVCHFFVPTTLIYYCTDAQ